MPTSTGLLCIASSPTKTTTFTIPPIDGYFSGVGDLFSAMVLARYHGDLALAVGQALYTVQMILKDTKGDTMASRELRIIQNPSYITSTTSY